jgi:hypothetical protein
MCSTGVYDLSKLLCPHDGSYLRHPDTLNKFYLGVKVCPQCGYTLKLEESNTNKEMISDATTEGMDPLKDQMHLIHPNERKDRKWTK